MLGLCGFGYGVQGFRCFPWLALNFHMAHNLRLDPSMMQIVQNIGNLPMVAKPLFGILSDAFYIGGAHRIPYIFLGDSLLGALSLIPVAGEALATLMLCVLLSNLGASITEVAQDALVAEYGQKHRKGGLQSYAFMAVAAGGILGNLFVSLTTKEDSLGLPQPVDQNLVGKSIFEGVREQFSNLMTTISEDGICRPLAWVVASIAMVPILSGPIFCYQTQCLCLDPSTIGMSRVILYASSLLLDLVLVRQINLSLGIPNQVFALVFQWGFGAGLASLIGIIGGDYSSLPVGILIQFLAALVPLGWMHLVPMVDPTAEKERKKGTSKRSRRNRRVGRVALDSIMFTGEKENTRSRGKRSSVFGGCWVEEAKHHCLIVA
ncbi:putative folate-biopterin transporter 9, chloroplastic [Vitis vinifera]|uniref:Putative folate-biopterin transporter 9, chloroplastic n=1 Tax=Vitis vinifera TaxID=29760 RepID=A0A438JEV3_VITVI|nr:putative folate-biopterin transporter 9, chloroplastic [Vitis vinifera]